MCANCHVVRVAIQMNDLDAIKAACKRLGWTFTAGQQTYRWYGRWVGDSPIPEHLFSPAEAARIKAMTLEERSRCMTNFLGKCDHAIQVPNAAYEIGVMKIADRYEVVWDWWGPGGLHEAMGEKGEVFAQAYGVERAKLEAIRQGCSWTEHQQQDGSVQVRVQLPDF